MSAEETKPVAPPRPCCPRCGSAQVALIMYGLLRVDEKLRKRFDEGDVVMGGCVVSVDAPRYHCRSCKHRWRDVA